MKTVLIIAGLAFLVWFFWSLFTSKPIPQEYLVCFIGGLGSGKTFLAVRNVVRWFKRAWRKYKWSCFFHPIRKDKRKTQPHVYSNIPIRLGNRFNRRMSEVLTTEHLFNERLKDRNSITFIDEVGQVADQYKFDLKPVKENVQIGIRFDRQWMATDVPGHMYFTEQASDFIAKPIRGRFNSLIEVRGLHRCLFFPLGKVKWREISVTNDVVNIKDVGAEGFNTYFFWMPYAKRYDSKVYSETYDQGFSHEVPERWEWDKLKTRYILDVRKKCTRHMFKPVQAPAPGESPERGSGAPSPDLPAELEEPK